MSKTVIRAITGVEAGDGPRPKLPRGSLSHFARPQRFVFFIYKREQRKTGLFGKDAKHINATGHNSTPAHQGAHWPRGDPREF